MVTQKALEALSVRVELDLWKGRRSIYGARRKVLNSEYVLKKDVVERMERSVLKHFSLFRESYEDKLAKEKREVDAAKKAYEKVLFYIEEGEKRIPELERQAEDLREVEICFDNKEQEEPSYIVEKGVETTGENLILWCELVEEGVFIANSITSFLENLVVYMECSNSGATEESEKILLEQKLYEIDEKVKKFFHKLRQDYEKMGMCKVKKFSVCSLILNSGGNLGLELQENAMLYTMRNKLEELQKRLVETFAAMEDDGARLLEKLKEENKDTENPEIEEKEKLVEKSSAKTVSSDHMENKYENQEKDFPSYGGNKSGIQQKVVFPDVAFHGQENLDNERDALLEGMRLLREELKSVRTEMQVGFKKSRGLFGKHRRDFNEEEVSGGFKKLERNLEAWRRQLKEFRRKARHFPCALDGFVSMESRGMDRSFETEDAVASQEWYLDYVDELETRMKTAEKQVTDFRIDV